MPTITQNEMNHWPTALFSRVVHISDQCRQMKGLFCMSPLWFNIMTTSKNHFPNLSKNHLCLTNKKKQQKEHLTLTPGNWTLCFVFVLFIPLLWEHCNPASPQSRWISRGIALVGLWESPRTTSSFRDIPRMQLHSVIRWRLLFDCCSKLKKQQQHDQEHSRSNKQPKLRTTRTTWASKAVGWSS